jgi:FAD/FMN-containing dehydrogenase
MTPDVTVLRTEVAGPVLVPGDEGFAAEATPFMLAATVHPDVVVGVANEADVQRAVLFASRNGLHVHTQATGHAAHGTLSGGLLITTRRLDTVVIDPVAEVATIGAGVRWSAVIAAAGEHGLTAITGSSGSVGAIGYTLGGGLGPYARSHGFSSDFAVSFRMVTADGELKVASAIENPDLFWALRGGRAGFGVVTELTFALVPLAEIYGGSLFFAAEHIETVLTGWLDWCATADPEVSTSIAIIRFPPIEELPPPLRGATALALRFVHPGEIDEGSRLAEPLRALAPVLIDTLGAMPTTKIALVHNDPDQPAPAWVNGVMLTSADAEFAGAFLARFGADARPPVVSAELRHLGNRTAIDVEGGSAVGGRGNAFTLGLVGVLTPDVSAQSFDAFWAETLTSLAPWTSSQTTINFAGHPSPARYPSCWPKDTFERLMSIAAEHDPQGIFSWR